MADQAERPGDQDTELCLADGSSVDPEPAVCLSVVSSSAADDIVSPDGDISYEDERLPSSTQDKEADDQRNVTSNWTTHEPDPEQEAALPTAEDSEQFVSPLPSPTPTPPPSPDQLLDADAEVCSILSPSADNIRLTSKALLTLVYVDSETDTTPPSSSRTDDSNHPTSEELVTSLYTYTGTDVTQFARTDGTQVTPEELLTSVYACTETHVTSSSSTQPVDAQLTSQASVTSVHEDDLEVYSSVAGIAATVEAEAEAARALRVSATKEDTVAATEEKVTPVEATLAATEAAKSIVAAAKTKVDAVEPATPQATEDTTKTPEIATKVLEEILKAAVVTEQTSSTITKQGTEAITSRTDLTAKISELTAKPDEATIETAVATTGTTPEIVIKASETIEAAEDTAESALTTPEIVIKASETIEAAEDTAESALTTTEIASRAVEEAIAAAVEAAIDTAEATPSTSPTQLQTGKYTERTRDTDSPVDVPVLNLEETQFQTTEDTLEIRTDLDSPIDFPILTSEEVARLIMETQTQLQSPPPTPRQQQQLQQQEQQQQQQQQQQALPPTAVVPKPDEKAICKYRWGKVVPTNSKRIIFFSSAHPKEPLFLHLCPQSEAFYSEELNVPCGDYAGHVIVEGKTYPVEAFNVRSYTFEVDLFLKEDVIEDEVATSNTTAEELKFQQQQQQGPVDTYRDISSSAVTSATKMEENGGVDENGIRHNSKYEDLLRQQLQHKDSLDASLETELQISQKSEQLATGSGSKRLTPVGDIDKEPFQDGYSALSMGDSGAFDFEAGKLGRSSERYTPQNLFSGSASELRQDYEIDRQSVKSAELSSSSRLSFADTAAGDPGLPKAPSRAGSDFSAGLGSGHVTPQRDLYDTTSGVLPGSGSHTPLDRRIDDVLGGAGSRSSSVRLTPTRETIGDVLGTEAALTNTGQSRTSGSAIQSPDRDVGVIGSSRSTPQRDVLSSALRSSQERLYGSQELKPSGEPLSSPGSRPISQAGSLSGSLIQVIGSRVGSQQGSRAQSLNSLTSEQELSQFLDSNNSHPCSEHRRSNLTFDTHPDESTNLPPIMRDRDRPISLPNYPTQSPTGVDKGTYTPDTTWLPMASETLGDTGFRELAVRGAPKSAMSSRASSRTITPVSGGLDREESIKVRDLEETVATLRKLLSSREQEVHDLTAQLRDLKDINQSLKKDLDHVRSRRIPAGPEELERQYEQLLQEKEILAGEVVKLRDRLETTKGTGVDSFSSNSATSLQRRIDELEAHVRDLRHSNDSTSQKMRRAEMRVKELTEENERLRSTSALHVHDLQDDRSGRYVDRRIQIEIQQLKEDVRTLRDRNFLLQDENLKLKEGKEPSRTLDFRSREPPIDLAGRSPLMTSSLRAADERQRPAESSTRDGLHTSEPSRSKHHDSPVSPGRRLDRSYGSDTSPVTSTRDPHQRSLDRSFGSDQGTRDNLREASSYSRSRLENGDKELSTDRLAKYRDYGGDHKKNTRSSSTRYDLLRSRPDGEVSEKLRAGDVSKYGTLSAEKLRSLDREHGRDRGESKVTMSAERLRILEEAERNRERRAQATASHRTASADNHFGSKDFYRSVKSRFGRRDSWERDKYSSLPGSLPSSLCTSGKNSLSDLFATDDSLHRKSEGNHSDDSDSTAILMSYDVKSDTFSGQREREKNTYSERSRPQDAYYERGYLPPEKAQAQQEKHHDREYRDIRGGYRETNGDDSDTATDILLSAEPARTPSHSPPRRRQRHSSIGDDASLSSVSDGEDPQESLRRRSKSADPKGKKGASRYGQTVTLRPSASTEMLGGGKTVTLSSGFRTVTPQPLTTQHNKNAAVQQQASLSSSFTQGLRPFAPRSPGDVRIEDVVKFSRQGGKLSQGTVKFVGHLPGRSDVYLGVELYKEEGKHDGTFEGIRYFKCKPSKGVFVAFNKIVMAWAPN